MKPLRDCNGREPTKPYDRGYWSRIMGRPRWAQAGDEWLEGWWDADKELKGEGNEGSLPGLRRDDV